MTKSLICVDVDTDLSEAAALMDKHHVVQLLVTCGAAVVGTITETELLAAVAANIRQSELGAPQNPPSRDDILAAIRKESWERVRLLMLS